MEKGEKNASADYVSLLCRIKGRRVLPLQLEPHNASSISRRLPISVGNYNATSRSCDFLLHTTSKYKHRNGAFNWNAYGYLLDGNIHLLRFGPEFLFSTRNHIHILPTRLTIHDA